MNKGRVIETFCMSVKLIIADDHVILREGIRQLMEFDGNMEVVAEVCDGLECINKVKELNPDLLLLDINMPKKNGMEVLKDIRSSNLKTKVLMLTVHDEVEYLLKALDVGVDGYILKEAGFSELKEAIATILRGEKYIQPEMVPLVNNRLVSYNTDKDKLDSLSKREREILKCISEGFSNKDISVKLDIREQTVKNHIASIFKKIEVSDRTQAAVFALKNDL